MSLRIESRRWRRAVAAILCLGLLAPAAFAQTSPRLQADQANTAQKATFLHNMVTKSVVAETIESSGDPAAQAELAAARDLVRQAQDDLAKGAFDQANEKLDQALRRINEQTRRLSQQAVKQERSAADYEKRLHTVQTFLKAYERVAGEKSLSAAASAQIAVIQQQVAEAEGLAAGGRHADAIEVLDRAYKTARGDIRELRDGQTLTRSLNFETAAEEYAYEKDRNDSHIMLLRFAMSEKQPPASFLKGIERLRGQALSLRQQAEQEAGGGQHGTAIETLNRSTDTLLKAIRMTGIYIPGA